MSDIKSSDPKGSRGKGLLRFINAREHEHVPVRNVVRRTSGQVNGLYPSKKNGRSVGWESQLEQKACELFEFSPAIRYYHEQPQTLYIPTPHKRIRYTPDFKLLLVGDLTVFVEVKPLEKLETQEVSDKMNAVSKHLSAFGLYFIVLTEPELDVGYVQRNLKQLRQYLQIPLPAKLIEQSVSWVKSEKHVDFQQLCQRLGSLQLASSLIANQHLTFNVTDLLSPETEITVPQENHNATIIFSYRLAPDFK